MDEYTSKLEELKKLVQVSRDERTAQEKTNSQFRADNVEKLGKIENELNQVKDEYSKKLNELEARNSVLESELVGLKRQDTLSGVRENTKVVGDEALESLVKYVRYGKNTLSPDEFRALKNTSDVDGGFLIPPAFEKMLITKAYELESIRPYANVGTTGRDKAYFSSLDQVSVGWAGAGAYPEVSVSSGQVIIDINKIVSIFTISRDTLEDAEADIIGELTNMVSLAISQEEDRAFAVGTSPLQPKGLFTNSQVLSNYVPTGVAANLYDTTNNGMDAIKNLISQIKPSYARTNEAVFAMNRFTETKVHQLKDFNGQYYWNPPTEVGKPATLLGYPVILPESAPNVEANSYPIIFGNLKRGYAIRDRSNISVRREDSRYTEYDLVAFVITKRTGGGVILPECFAALKVSET